MKRKLNLIYGILFALLGWISAVISIFNIEGFSQTGRTLIISFFIVASIVYIWLQCSIYKEENHNVIKHKCSKDVNAYLLHWLKSGGNTVIFTRDLTWARDSDVYSVLAEKASNHELTICLYQSTPITDKLRALGASIYEHRIPENQLKSRFTIVDYGKNNPRITVGTKDSNGNFINETFDMQNNATACSAFIELFELLKDRA